MEPCVFTVKCQLLYLTNIHMLPTDPSRDSGTEDGMACVFGECM